MDRRHHKDYLHVSVGVAVITKNRPTWLTRCLTSIYTQTESPDEVLVIDGGDPDETRRIIKHFNSIYSAKTVYIHDETEGYARARNRALKKLRTDWIAFTDDDCIADHHWIGTMKQKIKQHPHVAALEGKTLTLYPENIFSLALRFYEEYWKSQWIDGSRIINCEILDTKNVVFNTRFIQKNRLLFDESLSAGKFTTNDDVDFGMQIQTAGGTALYVSSLTVYHNDPTTLEKYLKKIITDALSYRIYRTKWKMKGVDLGKKQKFVQPPVLLSHIKRHYDIKWYRMVSLRILLFVTARLLIFVRLYGTMIQL